MFTLQDPNLFQKYELIFQVFVAILIRLDANWPVSSPDSITKIRTLVRRMSGENPDAISRM